MSIPFTHLDKLYINGQWLPTADSEAVLNPATEAVITMLPLVFNNSGRAAFVP